MVGFLKRCVCRIFGHDWSYKQIPISEQTLFKHWRVATEPKEKWQRYIVCSYCGTKHFEY
jgi:hypothetical protein